MLKIKVISVGKIKEKSLKNLIDEYLKRLSRFTKIKTIEIADLPVPENPSKSEIENVINKEAKEIIKHISAKSYVISLCIEGKKCTSVDLSRMLTNIQNRYSEITFIIGSSFGLSEEVKVKSDYKLSMSDMTFPHNIAKLMLIEQIYRGFKINNNENYHK